MEGIEISLNFDKTITTLSGNKYGKVQFEEQAKGKFEIGQEVCFVFPSNIENIASSFIQGFFEEIVRNIGIDGVEQKIDIQANSIENAKNYVIKKLSYQEEKQNYCYIIDAMKFTCEAIDVQSLIAIIISCLAIYIEYYNQRNLNKVNLNAEYFKHLYFDKILKNIPQERNKLKFNQNGILKNYNTFINSFLDILSASMYYKYIDKNYYLCLKKEIQDLEDYVYTTANKPVIEALHSEVLNEIDERVEKIYAQLAKKYEKG